MEKFSAEKYVLIGRLIGALELHLVHRKEPKLSPDLLTWLKEQLGEIAPLCQEVNLTLSVRGIKRMVESLEDSTFPCLSEGILQSLTEIKHRILDEMEETLFLYVPRERASLYDRKQLFGEAVNARFPSVQFDMIEAGNCNAAGRATACVFHLMRIMETGVQELGNSLSVPLVTEKHWQNILDEVAKAIRNLPPKDKRTKELAQASSNLYDVKVAWRNEVMHPKETYTLEEAEQLIGKVRCFMGHLATII